MKQLNKLFDYLLLAFLVIVLMLAASCSSEPIYSDKEIIDKPVKVLDYKVSSDIIRHYSDIIIDFKSLNYYPDCGFDTTNAIADFDLDGDFDIFLAPLCSDTVDGREPPIAYFENYGFGNFTKKDILIENNIGPLSGTTHLIMGDYNNDKKPDVVYISHNGHGGDGGFPSILYSTPNGYKFEDIPLDRKWYAYGASSDIDKDGDLDILLSWNTYLENNTSDGQIKFNYSKTLIQGMPQGKFFTMFNLMDLNGDGLDDIIGTNSQINRVLYNNNGSFNFDNGIDLPEQYSGDIHIQPQDRVVYDYDKDGLNEIITWGYPHASDTDGEFAHIQVLKLIGGKLTDITNTVFDNLTVKDRRSLEWLRFYDTDKDGNVELFENQMVENWKSWEWNGEYFSKL